MLTVNRLSPQGLNQAYALGGQVGTQISTQISGKASLPVATRMHGGTDTLGKPTYDFSTNSNALGPCPEVLTQIRLSDCASYPDPD